MLSGDILMMWGFLDDDIYINRYVRVGGIKGWIPRGKGFPVLSFSFLVVNFEGVELIGLVKSTPEVFGVPLHQADQEFYTF